MVYTLTHPVKPHLLNATRNKHWAVRAKFTDEWRKAGAILAAEARLPKCVPAIGITVRHHVSGKGKLPDPGSSVECVKAFIDGIVDYGLIEDDTGEHMRHLCFLAPERAKFHGLSFDIEVLDA